MTYFLVFAASAIVSLAAGAAVRRAAIRFGAVVPLRPDRWHRNPTPTFGGVGILIGVVTALAWFHAPWLQNLPLTGPVISVGAALFIIGWYDDVRPLFAAGKIVTSLAAAAFFVFTLAYVAPDLKPAAGAGLFSLVAILLFAGLDNAVNLLDNMDGLAAGTSAIAAVALAVTFHAVLGDGLVVVLLALAGGLAGFLFWNRNPAKLFMGNCGSLAVGGLLAACATVAVARTHTVPSAIAAGLILISPIFDTAFVVLLRRMAGRSTTKGYIDHVSHRLVSAGASEPRAVLIFYLLSAAGGAAGYLLQTEGAGTWPVPILVAVAAVMLGVYLARQPIYSGQDFVALQDGAITPLLSDLMRKWHLGELLLDLVLIATCYYSAYWLRFAGQDLTAFLWSFSASLPLILGCQIAALYASGLYSRAWSTFGFHDLWPVVRGVVIGSMMAIGLIVFLYKNTPELELFSRAVFIVDALLLITAIVLTRSSFRILKRVADTAGPSRKRVMIYGAGARGQLLVREMLANPAWLSHPVGFFDDDASKHGRRLMGIPVRGAVADMPAVLKKLGVQEVLLSSPLINGAVETRIREICGTLHVPVRRLHMEIQ